jgi:hypothetical protein
MITKNYNPSPLEVEMAKIINSLREEINKKLNRSEIVSVKLDIDADNPDLIIRTKDSDGDLHEFLLRIIQKPDSSVKPG